MIAPELKAELELQGVDLVRALLVSSTDGYSGTGRNTPISLGQLKTTRGEIQDWLKCKEKAKARREATLWSATFVVAAIAAAAAIVAAVEGWPR
jgi:hypothetical protein